MAVVEGGRTAHAGEGITNAYLRWYSRLVWIGLTFNLGFAVMALFAPHTLQDWMDLEPLEWTAWLRNVGMLLVIVSLFNAGAALAPLRYPLYSWLVPIARVIAATFFFDVVFLNSFDSADRPNAFITLAVFDLTFGVVCGALLYVGLRRSRAA